MTKRNTITYLACVGVMLVSYHGSFGFSLVQKGEPVAIIQLANEPNPVATEAAVELQRVVRRISGATLPICFEGEFHQGNEGPVRFVNRILVGDSKATRKSGVDVSKLPPEGFQIKVVGRKLILAGRDDPYKGDWHWRGHRTPKHLRGTAYAVYSFLERELGVRWLWPGLLGEVVPHQKNINVRVVNRIEFPKLRMRIIRNGVFNTGSTWQAMDKTGSSYSILLAQAVESDQWIDHQRLGNSLSLPVSAELFNEEWVKQFGKSHPEWFAMQPDGKRLVQSYAGRVRMCLSNPELLDEIARRADAYFAKYPYRDGFGVSLSDVYGSYCCCSRCKKWGPTVSDLVAHFYIACADRIAKKHPNKFVLGYAYHKYFAPPTTIKRLPKNVIILNVGKEAFGYLDEHNHKLSIASWLGWSKISTNKMIWRPNNFAEDSGLPVNYARKIAGDIKLFYKTGLLGTDMDSFRRYWSGMSLTYYVTAKLLWNPQADVDAIIDDYCIKGFGPAHKEIHDYFDALEHLTETIANDKPKPIKGVPVKGKCGLAFYYPPEITSKLRGILGNAKKAAGQNETVKARIDFLGRILDFADIEYALNIAGRSLAKTKEKPTPETIRNIRKLMHRRQAFLKRCVGTWICDPETKWSNADWVIKLLDRQSDNDIFAGLWKTYREVMTLPEHGWRFRTDPASVGEKQHWYARGFDDSNWKRISIGKTWEEQGFSGYDGIGWYRRLITVPKIKKGEKIFLAFGGVDKMCRVYIDGQLAGIHDIGPNGWDKLFVLDVTRFVKPYGQRLLAVEVIDTVGAGGIWRQVKFVVKR